MLQLDQAQTLALFQAPESVAENKSMQSFSRRTEKEANDSRLMLVSYVILAIVLGSSGFMYWQTTSNENDVIVPEVQSICLKAKRRLQKTAKKAMRLQMLLQHLRMRLNQLWKRKKLTNQF